MTKLLQMVCGLLLMSAAVPALASPAVPEPMSLSLLAVGAGGVAVARALRKRRD
jgi:hypothetical protein